MQRGLQFDQSIDHGVLGRKRRAVEGAGEQEHRTVAEARLGLQLVYEFLEFEIGPGFFMHRDQSVQHQNTGPASAYLASHNVEQAAQPVILQGLEGTDIGHPVGDRGFIEETHSPHVPYHAGMALREECDVECVATQSCLRKADLIAQNRFSGAGRPLNDIDAAFENTPTQNRIKPGYAGRKTIVLAIH
jgi:hypothetical protein